MDPHAHGALRADRFRERLHDAREIWLDGARVDVTTHPAFAGPLAELGRLFDLQHTDALRDEMTFVSPESGRRVSTGWLLPRTPAHLAARTANTARWAKESLGQLARAPEFMAAVVVGLYNFREEAGRVDPRFRDNIVRYHALCQERDLVLTHGICDPQIDRSLTPAADPDLALRVVSEHRDGVVVRGAKALATLAPLSDEILVYMSPAFATRERPEFVCWFAVPLATPGVRVLCREPLAGRQTGHAHPLADRYDEQDATVFFEDVLVPWDRVFLLRDRDAAFRGFFSLNAWAVHATQVRFRERVRTFVAVARMVAESIGVAGFRDVQNKLGELASYAEMVRLALIGVEHDARMTPGGLWMPGDCLGLSIFTAQISSRLREILAELAASGLVMQPSEADLASPELRPSLDRYLRGRGVDAVARARLMRIAWDLAGDGFSGRQEQYERWSRGDIVGNRIGLHHQVDVSDVTRRVEDWMRTG